VELPINVADIKGLPKLRIPLERVLEPEIVADINGLPLSDSVPDNVLVPAIVADIYIPAIRVPERTLVDIIVVVMLSVAEFLIPADKVLVVGIVAVKYPLPILVRVADNILDPANEADILGVEFCKSADKAL